MLAEVALALGVLDLELRSEHRVADPADQRLDARGAEQRVVDVVGVPGLEVAVGLVLSLLVTVAEHEELELGGGVRAPATLRQSRQLTAQDLAR